MHPPLSVAILEKKNPKEFNQKESFEECLINTVRTPNLEERSKVVRGKKNTRKVFLEESLKAS